MNLDGTCNGWTKEQNKTFENVLAMYGDQGDQWERTAAELTGKTIEEVKHHYQLLVEDVNAIESGCVPLPCYVSSFEDHVNSSADVALCEMGSQGQIQTGSINERKPLKSDQERRKGIAWTEDEHRLFLRGLEMYGRGDWKSISRYYVLSRTPTQVASHAQKYFLRLNATNKERRRSSIYDITISDNGDTSAPQGPIVGQLYGEVEAGPSNITGTSMPLTPGASVHKTRGIHMDDGHQLCEGTIVSPMMEVMAIGSSVINETAPPIWPNDWSWN